MQQVSAKPRPASVLPLPKKVGKILLPSAGYIVTCTLPDCSPKLVIPRQVLAHRVLVLSRELDSVLHQRHYSSTWMMLSMEG
jgi:hypothetical protein